MLSEAAESVRLINALLEGAGPEQPAPQERLTRPGSVVSPPAAERAADPIRLGQARMKAARGSGGRSRLAVRCWCGSNWTGTAGSGALGCGLRRCGTGADCDACRAQNVFTDIPIIEASFWLTVAGTAR